MYARRRIVDDGVPGRPLAPCRARYNPGRFASDGRGLLLQRADGSHDIAINYSAGGGAAPGGFDGFVFTFADAPTITGVTLDPKSSSGDTPALSFTGNQIFVNEAMENQPTRLPRMIKSRSMPSRLATRGKCAHVSKPNLRNKARLGALWPKMKPSSVCTLTFGA